MDPAKRKALQEDWIEEAKRSFDQFFGEDPRGGQVTFRQIEAAAVQEGDRVARWFLEKRLETERAECDSSVGCACPICGNSARPKEGGPEPREIVTKPGRISFERLGFYCPSCRKVFFPSGPKA